jgi:AcrR family transcriptional regulator
MKDAILAATIAVLADEGLNNWTVEEVAERAHCAKGLVNYHYRSKQYLLARAAESLRDNRQARRLAALQAPPELALDRLWQQLVEEVESGWHAAWLALVSADEPLRTAARSQGGHDLARAAGQALGVDLPPEADIVIPSALDGLQLQLLLGAPAARAEEAYHRIWVGVLSSERHPEP